MNIIDKNKIIDSFSKSAPDYDKHADLQLTMAKNLFSRIAGSPKKILDIGCGTGVLVKMLAQKYPSSDIVGVDLAPGMINAASFCTLKNAKFFVCDGEALPFNDKTFDLVVSSAALQWMDINKAIKEAARVLNPGGEFYFATFGPKTLKEVREKGFSVNEFPDKTEFCPCVIESEIVIRHYQDLFELFRYLRQIGAQISTKPSRQGLMGRKTIMQSGLEVTFEIYYGLLKAKTKE